MAGFDSELPSVPSESGTSSVTTRVHSTATESPVSPTSPSTPRVSFILATLNERQNLPVVIDRIRQESLPPFEVVVIDDGSTDGTREYVTQLAASDPRFRPIFHDGKQTTLRAQCQAIGSATGEFVVVMDSDLQHPPSVVPQMIHELDHGAALVVASRYAPGGSPGRRSAGRILLSRGAEGAAKLLLRDARGLSDPVSGFFAFRRAIFQPVNPLYRGYKLLLFVLVMSHGHRVAEVPFQFVPRATGSSKVTQGFGFIPAFLVEVLLAKRLEATISRRSKSFGAVPKPSE
ncbi:MAG: glycosyltransferase [Thermoplasmata archaeon]